jgi:type VI secretion system protein ImpH
METIAVVQPELEEQLRNSPTSFEFFQAVRLLERLLPDRKPVGFFGDPGDEVARFAANPDTAFPASEIQTLELPGDTPARIAVNFMGLTGPEGVLPYSYSLLVEERIRARDTTLRDFLDLFHHRIISLFYRAWEKYRFGVAHERDQRDVVTQHLKDLVGLGGGQLQDRLDVRDEVLLFYAGLLAPQQRSAAALQQLLEDYFGVPVEVEQFVGGWYPLSAATQCAVGNDDDASEQLGWGAVAGDEVWDPQARVRLRLGPLTRRQYDQFLPNGSAFEPLQTLTRFFCSDQLDFEVQLQLARDEVPVCALGVDGPGSPLGWCTWMRSQVFARDPDDTILTL